MQSRISSEQLGREVVAETFAVVHAAQRSVGIQTVMSCFKRYPVQRSARYDVVVAYPASFSRHCLSGSETSAARGLSNSNWRASEAASEALLLVRPSLTRTGTNSKSSGHLGRRRTPCQSCWPDAHWPILPGKTAGRLPRSACKDGLRLPVCCLCALSRR